MVRDVRRHLALAFNSFLGREAGEEGVDEETKEKFAKVQADIQELFSLTEEDKEKLSVNCVNVVVETELWNKLFVFIAAHELFNPYLYPSPLG